MVDLVNVGITANDNAGDPLRDAFIKVNELAASAEALGIGANITRIAGDYTIQLSDNGKTVFQTTSGTVTIPDSLTTMYAGMSVIIKNGGTGICVVEVDAGGTLGGIYAGLANLDIGEQCTVANTDINEWSYTGYNSDRLIGGKTNFDFTALDTYQLHWDASDGATLTQSGGFASQLNNKGLAGSAYNLTQATGASQPAVISNAVGTLTGLRFDGTDDVMSCTGITSLFYNNSTVATDGFTIAIVCANRNIFTSSGSQRIFAEGRTDNSTLHHLSIGLNTLSGTPNVTRRSPLLSRVGGGTTAYTEQCEEIAWDELPSILVWREVVNSGGTNTVTLFCNGDKVIETTYTPTYSSATQINVMSIGAQVQTSAARFWNGDFYELAGFNEAFSDAEMLDMTYTLAAKWRTSDANAVTVRYVVGQSNGDERGLDAEVSSTITDFYTTTSNNKHKCYRKNASRTGNVVTAATYADDGNWWMFNSKYQGTAKQTDQVIGDGSSDESTQSNVYAAACALSYGKVFSDAYPNAHLFHIRFAVGGSTLQSSGWDVTNKRKDRLYYCGLKYVYIPAIRKLRARGLPIKEIVVYKAQGESDTGLSQAGYAALLNTWCDRSDAELGHAMCVNQDMPVKIAIMGLSSVQNINTRNAQKQVADARINVVYVPTDGSLEFDGVTTNTYFLSDGIHYTTASQELLGTRVFAAIEYLRTLE